jgi:hypothetical protein
MISSLVAGVVLLFLLLAVATKGWLASRDLHEPRAPRSEDDATESCPEEFLLRIFSRDDWDFVRTVNAGSIERLFERERKRVALMWVRQTSATIRRVMRGHAKAARQSQNLEVSMEVNILTQYLLLMAVCGMLSMAIQIAGPLWLGGLAHFAQRLSLRIASLQESFLADVLAKTTGPRPISL